ncbi:MAG: hypothetical protein Q9M91_05070 [Candidatus Dojkabacteria bacterium]|nr:hypothetical protein [Candidatus Dojkabacteria bacterium]MDQ7021177.1 hypothetical protein [Candidatus Dojkabacteria bacterium]
MNKIPIIINGPARSGKDTFIKMCRLFLLPLNIPVYSYSSILPIKMRMLEDGIWDGKSKKTEERRTYMVNLKKEMSLNGDLPTKYLLESFNSSNPGIIFFHIREAAEIKHAVEIFKKELGVKLYTLHYMRLDESIESFNSGVDHLSQTREYENYDFDIVNDTKGLKEMSKIVRNFLLDLKLDKPAKYINLSDLKRGKIHIEFNDEDKNKVI